MRPSTRLYERAVADTSAAVLHAGESSSFWAGTAQRLDAHQGGAAVLLAGLYGKFRLRLQGQDWTLCRAAFIPAGVWHELDFFGEPFAAVYAEPSQGGHAALVPLLRCPMPLQSVLTGETDAIALLRDVYEDSRSETWVGQAIDDLLGFARRGVPAEPWDGRLARVIDLIANEDANLWTAQKLAQSIGLSASRFQHVFTQQAGVPFRRYRAWSRLRRAWLGIAKGATITQAAHAAGFFDSAHLAREYRRTFGAVPSNGLRRNYRVSG
jgi:AraC-like DNA-binding protein